MGKGDFEGTFGGIPKEAKNNKGWRYEIFFWDTSKGTFKITLTHKYNGGIALYFDGKLENVVLPSKNPFGGENFITIKKEYIPGDHTVFFYAHETGAESNINIATTITPGWEYKLG
jgi:hypothetical protein